MNDPEEDMPGSGRIHPLFSDRDSIQNLADLPNPSIESVVVPDLVDLSNCEVEECKENSSCKNKPYS